MTWQEAVTDTSFEWKCCRETFGHRVSYCLRIWKPIYKRNRKQGEKHNETNGETIYLFSSWAGSQGADNTEQPLTFANCTKSVRSVAAFVAQVSNEGTTPPTWNRKRRRTGATLGDLQADPSEAKGDDVCCGAAALFIS